MLKLGTVRFRGKCARHPRYNPALDGEAAIRGGCPRCHLLLELFHAHRRMVDLMRRANQMAEKARTEAPRTNETQLETQLELFACAVPKAGG